jgi:hypothetical protein
MNHREARKKQRPISFILLAGASGEKWIGSGWVWMLQQR